MGKLPESVGQMIDAFEELGIKRSLLLEVSDLRESFRERGKLAHPDAGGGMEAFLRLQQSLALLSEPSSRLRHWLELNGVEGDIRGAISLSLVDFFDEISRRLAKADALIRERKAASSHLAKALLEGRVHACREELEDLQGRISEMTEERVAGFGGIERGEIDGWKVARDLAFLGKWMNQVKERYAELW